MVLRVSLGYIPDTTPVEDCSQNHHAPSNGSHGREHQTAEPVFVGILSGQNGAKPHKDNCNAEDST